MLFRNLEHVPFCEILQKKFHLWSAVIERNDDSVVDVRFWKFISSVKVLIFKKKIQNFSFEIEFRN